MWGRNTRFQNERIAILSTIIFACSPHSATPAPVQPNHATPPVECRIAATASAATLRLEAIAHAKAPISGTYRFFVSKRSPTGTSQNMQGGKFTLKSDQRRILTVVILDASAVGHYAASLTLEWYNGRSSCKSP